MLAHREVKDSLDSLVHKDRLVNKVPRATQDHPVYRVLQVLKVPLARRDSLAALDSQASWVSREILARREALEQQGTRASWGHRAKLDSRESLGRRELLEIRDRPDLQAIQDRMDRVVKWVQLVSVVLPVTRVILVWLDRLVHLGPLEIGVLLVQLEFPVLAEILDLRE
jgi:hypothetical protein